MLVFLIRYLSKMLSCLYSFESLCYLIEEVKAVATQNLSRSIKCSTKKIFFNVTKQIICIYIVHIVRPVSVHDVLEEGVGELPGDLAQAAPQLLAVQPQTSLFH